MVAIDCLYLQVDINFCRLTAIVNQLVLQSSLPLSVSYILIFKIVALQAEQMI